MKCIFTPIVEIATIIEQLYFVLKNIFNILYLFYMLPLMMVAYLKYNFKLYYRPFKLAKIEKIYPKNLPYFVSNADSGGFQ